MKTKMNLDIDLTEKAICFTTDTVPVETLPNGLTVYIPLLMSNIRRGSARTSTVRTNGSSIFANASDCKPRVSSTLREKNYLRAFIEYNNSIERHLIARKINGRIRYFIPAGVKLQLSFTHGKLSSITFNTNNF